MWPQNKSTSQKILCTQSKGLSVIEIYSEVEGLDITMHFYFLLMGKMTMCMWKVHNFMFFSTWERDGRQVFLVLSSFLEGNQWQPWKPGGSHSCLMWWRSGLIHWLCPCKNRISNEYLKAVYTREGLQKHFTGAFSGTRNEIGFNKAKKKRF